MVEFLSDLFRVKRDEWAKLFQLGMFGFLLQMGLGIGFSAGDSAFLSNVGADRLPLVFMLTPLVMLVYTGLFSYLLLRFSLNHMVDITLAMLVAGGIGFWALMQIGLSADAQATLYLCLKLYLAMWYIALYSLFWNYIDAHFDIQDAKRLFPLLAALCALGTAAGALVVSLLAETVPLQSFFLLWAAIALVTMPLARWLRKRWRQIAENEIDFDAGDGSTIGQLAAVGKAFGRSRYTMVFTLTLFVTLLLTNLAEYQYSMVLQEGRSEAELARLFGLLYAAANVFNLVTCLFVFNRMVARFGVRNVAFVQPLTYFAVFGYFFLHGGTGAAFAAFLAYHGVLTSIEYNNENLLFNAVPSKVKRPLRTVVEGMAEPLASLVAGGFLLFAATSVDIRELSGIGLITAAVLIAVVVALRQLYPAAMAANMRQGWMNFGDNGLGSPKFEPPARDLLESEAMGQGPAAVLARKLLHPSGAKETGPQDEHCDGEAVPGILAAAAELAPRELRTMTNRLVSIGETAIPRLMGGLRDRSLPYRSRSVAARALADISYAQFASQMRRLVQEELQDASRLLAEAELLKGHASSHPSVALLARNQQERVGASVDFALELLAIGGLLPNFDLLIVSLHSANAKVRGNAIESIESGLDMELFRLLEPLLHVGEADRGPAEAAPGADVGPVLEAALACGEPIAMTLAADALHSRLAPDAFALHLERVIGPGMPDLLRGHLLALMGLGEPDALRPLDVLAGLAVHPELGGATLEALLELARRAVFDLPGEPAIGGIVEGRPFWVPHHALREIAGRFADLALVILRSQDDRQYAA